VAVWGGGSPSPAAVVQAGPQHRPPIAGAHRHAAEPILAPFAGLAAHHLDTGAGTVVILRAAHATLVPQDASLRLSCQEWHLASSSSAAGGAQLRPVKAVELPSFCLGGRSEMDLLRAEAGAEARP